MSYRALGFLCDQEKVRFSLAVENEVEGTWKSLKEYKIISRYILFCDSHVTVESHAWGRHKEISCYCVDTLLLPCELRIHLQCQIHTSTEKNDSTCVTQLPNGPSVNRAHLREKIRLQRMA